MQARKYLVLGATGLVGGAVVRALERNGDAVIVVSRRKPDVSGAAAFVSLDLTACLDTETMFRHQLRRLQAERVLPQ
jgi:nucleoside-diphosphate-sugar epimerase